MVRKCDECNEIWEKEYSYQRMQKVNMLINTKNISPDEKKLMNFRAAEIITTIRKWNKDEKIPKPELEEQNEKILLFS